MVPKTGLHDSQIIHVLQNMQVDYQLMAELYAMRNTNSNDESSGDANDADGNNNSSGSDNQNVFLGSSVSAAAAS